MLHIEKLSESVLHTVLAELFPKHELLRQKRLKINNKTLIVDFEVSKITTTYIEFDGPTHYYDSKTQIRDKLLTKYCREHGINLVRLPYFVQLDLSTTPILFPGNKYKIDSEYKSGFIDPKIIYPGNYNHFGWELFFRQFESLVVEKPMKEIWTSLVGNKESIELKLGVDWYLVPSKVKFVNYF